MQINLFKSFTANKAINFLTFMPTVMGCRKDLHMFTECQTDLCVGAGSAVRSGEQQSQASLRDLLGAEWRLARIRTRIVLGFIHGFCTTSYVWRHPVAGEGQVLDYKFPTAVCRTGLDNNSLTAAKIAAKMIGIIGIRCRNYAHYTLYGSCLSIDEIAITIIRSL